MPQVDMYEKLLRIFCCSDAEACPTGISCGAYKCAYQVDMVLATFREPDEAMVEAMARALCKGVDLGNDPDELLDHETPRWVAWRPLAEEMLQAAIDQIKGGE